MQMAMVSATQRMYFPLDASESLDADGDGIGNNRDPNDDNDSHDDWRDIFST